MRVDSAPVEPEAHSGCREANGSCRYTYGDTHCNRGISGRSGSRPGDTGLASLCGRPWSGALCDSRRPKGEEGACSQKGLGSVCGSRMWCDKMLGAQEETGCTRGHQRDTLEKSTWPSPWKRSLKTTMLLAGVLSRRKNISICALESL